MSDSDGESDHIDSSNVRYEKREGAHGVLFNVDFKLKWMPVCGWRKK